MGQKNDEVGIRFSDVQLAPRSMGLRKLQPLAVGYPCSYYIGVYRSVKMETPISY